jgi:hypothetical protein
MEPPRPYRFGASKCCSHNNIIDNPETMMMLQYKCTLYNFLQE